MSIRLAIVDDSVFIREIIRHLSKQGDIEIVGEAEDGNSAINMALSVKPDVIIMDLVLPLQSGIDATKEILSSLPNTKIIACSTVDQEHFVMQALEAGCCDYVVKPFEGHQIINAVKKAVGEKCSA